MGDSDQWTIIDFPDDATVAPLALRLGAQGTPRTKTIKAFPEEAFLKIVEGIWILFGCFLGGSRWIVEFSEQLPFPLFRGIYGPVLDLTIAADLFRQRTDCHRRLMVLGG